jgi:hypothetical protein
MANLLDRAFQLHLLQVAAAGYPQLVPLKEELASNEKATRVNIAYLEEHGLIRGHYPGGHGRRVAPTGAVITAQGIDFLSNDGGLGAILGVVTVRLHEETLKALIASKVEQSDLPPSEKSRILDQLKELPGETTKHLVLRLVDAGLDNWQKALPLLQNMLG